MRVREDKAVCAIKHLQQLAIVQAKELMPPPCGINPPKEDSAANTKRVGYRSNCEGKGKDRGEKKTFEVKDKAKRENQAPSSASTSAAESG